VRYIVNVALRVVGPPSESVPHTDFNKVDDVVDLEDAFTSAIRHCKEPEGPEPPALLWAGAPAGDVKTLLARFNEHPEVVGKQRVAAAYNGEVVLTDLSHERPSFTASQTTAVASLGKLPAAELQRLSTVYAVARSAGRLSSWPAVEGAWQAALTRRDSDAAAMCAFGVRVMDAMAKNLAARSAVLLNRAPPAARTAPPPPPGPTAPPAPTPLEDFKGRLKADVEAGLHRLLVNVDEHTLELELQDARAQQFRPVLATDLKRLRALAGDGDEVKWVIKTDGTLQFGPMTVTHPAVAGGKPIIAAGQAYLFETPDRRLAVLRLTNHSGHYQPSKDVLAVAEAVFAAHGIPAPKKTHQGYDT
jgi:hypothetical protein